VTELNSSRTVLVSTVTQRCEIFAACACKYTSSWNFIQFCCLQWKLYTKNLGGPLIMAHCINWNIRAREQKATDVVSFSPLSFNLANFLLLLVVRSCSTLHSKCHITLVVANIIQHRAVALLLDLLYLLLQFIHLFTSHLLYMSHLWHLTSDTSIKFQNPLAICLPNIADFLSEHFELQRIKCIQYTGWLKIKYPTRQYAISSQPVVRF